MHQYRPFVKSHLHSLARGASTLVNVLSSCIAAHKRDGLDVGVVADAIHCLVGAMYNIEHAPEK